MFKRFQKAKQDKTSEDPYKDGIKDHWIPEANLLNPPSAPYSALAPSKLDRLPNNT